MKEEWLMSGAFVPVDMETTAALAWEIKRLLNVISELTLNQQRPWVGLTDEELAEFSDAKLGSYDLCLEVEAKLKEKNT